jgi:hypothetical protein
MNSPRNTGITRKPETKNAVEISFPTVQSNPFRAADTSPDPFVCFVYFVVPSSRAV